MADNLGSAFVELRVDLSKLQGDANDGAAKLEKALAGVDWATVRTDAERTGEAIQGSFAEAARQSDTELEKIGGPDVWGDVTSGAERAGESIEGSMREAANQSDRHLSSIKTAGAGMFGSLAGLAAGAGAGLFIKGAVGDASEAASGMRQLQAVIESTGGAAGLTAQQVQDIASNLSLRIGVDDDEIIAAQTTLLAFKNVSGDVFPQATALAADMSAVFGGDLQGNTKLLGKALEDPIDGLAKLKKVGVDFTDSEKAQIEAMVAAGDVAGAQGIILDKLQGKIGGAAEAAATGGQKIGVAFGEMKESLGGGIATAIEGVAPSIVGLMDTLGPMLGTLGDSLGSAIGPLFEVLGPALQELMPVVSSILSSMGSLFSALAPIIGPIVKVVGELGKALGGALQSAIKAITPALEIIGDVLSDVIADVLPIIISLFDELSPIIALVGEIISTTLAAVLPPLADAFGKILAALQPIIPVLGDALMQIITALAPIIPPLAEAFLQIVNALLPLLPALLPLIPPIADLAVLLVQIGAPIITAIADAIAFLAGVIAPLVEAIAGFVAGAVEAVVGFIGNIGEMPGKIGGFLDEVVAFFTGLPGKMLDAIVNLATDIGGVFADMATQGVGAVTGFIADVVTFFTELPGKAVDALLSLGSSLAGAIASAATTGVAAVGTFVTDGLAKVGEFVTGIPGALLNLGTDMAANIASGLASALTAVGTWVTDALSKVGEFVTGIPGKILGVGTALADGVKSALKSAWNTVVDLIPSFTIPNPLPWGDDWKIDPGGWLRWNKMGGLFNGPQIIGVGEAGDEAVIPMTRPGRAMQLMEASGLGAMWEQMRGGSSGGWSGPAIAIDHATFQDATDADLVAQRVNVALSARLVSA